VEILDEAIVDREAFPSYRTRVLSAPSLALVAGDVLAVFRTGSAKVSPDGRIGARLSRDDGRTWQPAAGPFDGLGDDGRNHAGSHLGGGDDRGGTVLAIAARFTMTAPGVPGWDADRAGIVDADAVLTRRDADGRWSSPAVIDARRHPDEWAIACGPAVTLGNGEWLQPMERHDRSDRADWQQRYHAFALRSRDDGRSWPAEVAMPNDPTGRLAHYDQRLTITADGRLLTYAWIHDVVDDRTLPARVAHSVDGGATWSEPAGTSLHGGPINPITLRDGRVLIAYARREPPAGIRSAIAPDAADPARFEEEVVLYDGERRVVTGEPASRASDRTPDPLWGSMWGWTFGSPCPLELADGSVLVAFFAMDGAGVYAIRSVRLRP
jgi:sialidase-1